MLVARSSAQCEATNYYRKTRQTMKKDIYKALYTTLVSLLLTVVCLPTLGQTADRTVSGTVTDEKGEGLPGVSIVLKGSTRGSTTDVNGQFKILVPQNATLTISFVGYEKQEIAVGNRSTVDVKLTADNKSLDEVVVVGYGTQRKSDLTGFGEFVERRCH